MVRKILPFSLLFILNFFNAKGQQWLENAEIGVDLHYGSFLTSNNKSDYIKDSYSWISIVSFSKPIKKLPFPAKAYPTQWGVAAFFGNSGSKAHMGNMGGAYAFLDYPLAGAGWGDIRMRTGLGIGVVEKPYNVETNYKNLLIGSHGNIFIQAGIRGKFHLTKQTQLHAGISISHLSNGSYKLPNLGLNIPSVTLGISRILNPSELVRDENNPSSKTSRLQFQATTGVKQSPWVHSNSYGQFVLSSEYSFKNSAYGRFYSGISFLYDGSLNKLFVDSIITVGLRNYSRFNLAPIVGYELVVGKISVPIHVGVYLIGHEHKIYQNYGIRYRFHPALSAGGFLKSHGGTADFIHLGISYHLK
ncbi:MAG: acyloxyacyl hydrolase [Flavisolibacter sp.]|jgi:hypothetical protein|nr:acyloxyacyl hydrolase [Flavisolibacter sp.]